MLVAAVLSTASVRTTLAGAYEVTHVAAVLRAAGIAPLVVTCLAYYGAVALLLEDTTHRTVLPLARRGQSGQSLSGALEDQTGELSTEAGVRRAL